MEPTLTNGSQLNVIRYNAPVENGDLIVFEAPTSIHRESLKRVIAGPGQTIEISSGQVQVDGRSLSEAYVQGPTECSTAGCTFTIPANAAPAIPEPANTPIAIAEGPRQPECKASACYFVLGDNRQNSSDSRQGWLVPVQNIIGYVRPGN